MSEFEFFNKKIGWERVPVAVPEWLDTKHVHAFWSITQNCKEGYAGFAAQQFVALLDVVRNELEEKIRAELVAKSIGQGGQKFSQQQRDLFEATKRSWRPAPDAEIVTDPKGAELTTEEAVEAFEDQGYTGEPGQQTDESVYAKIDRAFPPEHC